MPGRVRANSTLPHRTRVGGTVIFEPYLRWLAPGHNPVSGWYQGRQAFLDFMAEVGRLSNGSFQMESVAVMVSDEYSADVTHNVGYRAGFEGTGSVPYTKLDINVVHVLRWRDGKVIEGRGAIFGDGTNQYDQFWGPTTDTARI